MTPEELERRSHEEGLRLREESARLSVDIERQIKFKDGPLNYILASAFREAVDAVGKLVDVDPTKVDEVRNLQNEIKRYADIAYWLHNAVVMGEKARQELEHTDIVDGWDRAFSAGED